MGRCRVLVIGSANMDLVVKTPRMPAPGETIIGGDFAQVRGGKGANQAVACARLGAETWMLARVGRDAFGEDLVRGLSEDGVRCDYVRRDEDAPSGVAMIIVDDAGENTIVVAPGANMQLTPADVMAIDEFGRFDAVLCQLEVALPVVSAAFARAREEGVLTVLDAGPPQRLPSELLHRTDVLSPNEPEARAILGEMVDAELDPEDAATRLLSAGAGAVVLKLGAEGAMMATADGVCRIPAFKVDPVDTTGAGDAFTAALAVSLAEGKELSEATAIAAGAGALATTVFGAAPSMPTRQALEEFLGRSLG